MDPMNQSFQQQQQQQPQQPQMDPWDALTLDPIPLKRRVSSGNWWDVSSNKTNGAEQLLSKRSQRRQFRQAIERNVIRYQKAPNPLERSMIISSILQSLRNCGLQVNGDDVHTRRRIATALRDAVVRRSSDPLTNSTGFSGDSNSMSETLSQWSSQSPKSAQPQRSNSVVIDLTENDNEATVPKEVQKPLNVPIPQHFNGESLDSSSLLATTCWLSPTESTIDTGTTYEIQQQPRQQQQQEQRQEQQEEQQQPNFSFPENNDCKTTECGSDVSFLNDNQAFTLSDDEECSFIDDEDEESVGGSSWTPDTNFIDGIDEGLSLDDLIESY